MTPGLTIQPHWVDLPEDPITAVLGIDNSDAHTLEQMITQYHELSKTDRNLLSKREQILKSIAIFLSTWEQERLKPEEKQKHLRWVQEIALSKAAYLSELEKLRLIEKAMGLNEYLQAMHGTLLSAKTSYQPITLTNYRYFSLKKKDYWGDFWWVTLDPCHRQLSHYLLSYSKQQGYEPTFSLDFFLWLETQYVPETWPREHYMTEEEKESYRVEIDEGLLVNSYQELLSYDYPDKDYIFVIDLQNNLYITEETHTTYHSCFCRGGPVLVAGKIAISLGIIQSVSFESGHYTPSVAVGYQFFQILVAQGYRLEAPIEVSYFSDRQKYTVSVPAQEFGSFSSFDTILKAAQQKEAGAACSL